MTTFDRNKIKAILKPIIIEAYQAEVSDKDLRANTLDIFSASLESTLKDISFAEWVEGKRNVKFKKRCKTK